MIQSCGKSIDLPLTIIEERPFPKDLKNKECWANAAKRVQESEKKQKTKKKQKENTIDPSVFFPYSIKFLKV